MDTKINRSKLDEELDIYIVSNYVLYTAYELQRGRQQLYSEKPGSCIINK